MKKKEKKITYHDSMIKKTDEPSKPGLSRKTTKNVSDIRFMCNINYA